jgi:rare lipoprotein A
MRPRLAMRELALAALALLVGVGAIAVTEHTRDRSSPTAEPQGSYHAIAGSSGPAAFGRRTACGGVIHADTIGVAHPTLPCGAKLFVTYRGQTVLTQVIDRGPNVPGREFDLTDALARRLGLQGQKQITWAYARTG